jgi:Xaa-Pro aminopeptidase
VFAPKAPFNKVTLFLKPRDPEAERWTGPREPISPELKDRYGVDRVRRGSPDTTLEGAGENHDCVSIIAPPSMAKEDRNDAELAARVAQRFGLRLVHQRSLLAGLREVHSAAEIERMERAIAITRTGHEAIAKGSVAGVSERDLQTQMEYAFFANGATGLSYSSIVGSGPNGAVLHWDKNSRLLKDGDLVVVDAAAEYGRYAADVTRTYPVSGKFSAEQAKVYRAVYQAQEDILAAIRPGVSMAELQHVAEESLRRAGYLKDFIHGFGHFVGLDVHDAGLYEKPLPVGAIFTVEPGVYLPERGFGVRIEDEVIVTPTGYRLLTAAFPRKLEDVEAWIAKVRR